MIINKLYCEDEYFFDSITFHDGFNIILGEKSESSEKRNGVGKSIAIEFINFVLLKDLDKSRLSKLPKKLIEESSPIMLDLTIEGEKLTIKRSLKEPDFAWITSKSVTIQYPVTDAKNLLLSKFNFKKVNSFLSFRDLVNPLTRDERCEFKSIPKYSDTNLNVPVDYSAHIFYLGLDNDSLHTAMILKGEINSENAEKTKANNQLQLLTGKDGKDAKVELNRLSKESEELSAKIENDKLGAFDIVDDASMRINEELTSIRRDIASLRHKITQVSNLSYNQEIDVDAVKVIYEKIRGGLGDAIGRSLQEALEFKQKISEYTNNIASHKIEKLKLKLLELESRRSLLISERDLRSKTGDSIEYDIKELIEQVAVKNEMITFIKSGLKRIELLENSIKSKKLELDQTKLEIDLMLQEYSYITDAFEGLILDAHKALFDELSASFEITTNNRKEIVSFDLRIKEDGSHSNERAKVFIYDFSLLLHDKKYSNHLGFLIHDNIFDNDDDTVQKALNFIEGRLLSKTNRQYILTLNSDKLSSLNLDFNIHDYARASFTKSSKFLKRDYNEV